MRQYIPLIRIIQLVLDLIIIQIILYILVYYKLNGEFPYHYQVLAVSSTMLVIIFYHWARVYHHFRSGGFASEIKALLKAWMFVMLTLTMLGFITTTTDLFSRDLIFKWAVTVVLAMVVVHYGVNKLIWLLRARGYNQRRSILIGDEKISDEFFKRLQKTPALGIVVLGYVGIDQKKNKISSSNYIKKLGNIADLKKIISDHKADLIYLTLDLKQSALINDLMTTLMPLHVDIHWVPDIFNLELLNHGMYEVSGHPVLCLSDSPFIGISRVGKWFEDKILALFILFIISPFMVIIMIAIKLTSPGPIIFVQKRIGYNGKTINTYKFRTMFDHIEKPGQLSQAVQNDPRLTPIGLFLRRTSIDELPQFINVIQGTMSIVGPRPHANEHDSYYSEQISSYLLRHRVKPGITGWAQVNGWRGLINTTEKIQKRIEYDLYYINNWSFSFDIFIIWKTIMQMIIGKNAH